MELLRTRPRQLSRFWKLLRLRRRRNAIGNSPVAIPDSEISRNRTLHSPCIHLFLFTQACALCVMNHDDLFSSSNEVELKLRAQNQLVGRLIGKQGATIKKIMSETETVIYVSK